MANLEFANLFLPATSAPGAVVAAGTAVAVDAPALAQTPSFSQLLQAGATREPATGAVIAGLAGMSALFNGAGMPAANQPRVLRPELAVVAPVDLGTSSLDLPTTAALLAEALMPAAETGETGDSKDASADADPVDLEDPAAGAALAVVQWPGLPLFMEARAALRNDSATGSQPEKAASVTGIESARWSFMLRSVGAGQLAGGDGAPASLMPATPEISTPEISATDAAELAAVISEIELSPAQTESESPEPVSFNAPFPANPVASLVTSRADQTAQTMSPEQLEPTDPAALHLRNPVAQLATSAKPERIEPGPLNPVASLATSTKPERIEPGPLNPVASLATSAKPERIEPGPLNPVASLATAAKPERIEPGPLNPVAQLATSAKPERIEPGPLNPVASLATSAKPERIEPGPLNPVAQLAGTDKTSPLAAANENAAAVRDRVAASLPGLQSAQAPFLRPHPQIAAPFTTYTESEPLSEDRAAPAEPVAWLDDAPPPNAVKPERPATPFTPVSTPLQDAGQVRRSPAELAVAPGTPHQEPAILDATTTPLTVEPAPPIPTGSPAQAIPSPATPTRLDPATVPTSLPTTPDTVDLNQKNWGRTLGHQLNWMVNNQLQQAEIRVNPPDLGPIELRVSLQNNQTSVTFFCHESAVREALENALPRLREMLDSQGISLNQAQVSDQSLARQQAGGGGQPSFSQRDDRPPANPLPRETVANETEPSPRARRLPGTVDDYA
jgi:hypothetical protein